MFSSKSWRMSGGQLSGTFDGKKIHYRHLFVWWIDTHYSVDLLDEFEDALKVVAKGATYYGRHESLSDGSYQLAVDLESRKESTGKMVSRDLT